MTSRRSSNQERLLAFLLDPKSYPHRPRKVQPVQTHASFVFIAPPFVLKVKKPVDFGFLDFSTLEKRREACEREVALNRRLAPHTYLGVVPITRCGRGFVFNGSGKVIEYAVRMRKLSEGHFLDRLLERRKIGNSEIDRIARTLADFYRAQHPGPAIEDWGRVDHLRVSTDENFRQTRRFAGKTISRPAFDAIRRYTDGFYRAHRALFEKRVRQGWIRDCHGDLHLEHIHLTSRAVTIYDCIEFNDRFRYVDVANDAAFLAMDLDYEGRPDLGRHFAGRLAHSLGDEDMPELLDFYKCYRAFVRGKVESLHGTAPQESAEAQSAAAERARRYFRLALTYAVAGSRPTVFAVMGRIGSGKSSLARALAGELGWAAFSSDQIRKETAGLPLFERTPSRLRSRLYSEAATLRTYRALARRVREQLRQGHHVIVDATFGRREQREEFRRALRAAHCRLVFLEAHAPGAKIRTRLKQRDAGGREISDARSEDFEKLARSYEPPRELHRGEVLRIASGAALHRTVACALEILVRTQFRRD